MKNKEVFFAIIFLIISYYMITEKEFLSQDNTRDLAFHSILVIGAFAVTLSGVIDFRKLKKKKFKYKIITIFCIASSLIFILATIYRIIFMFTT